MRCARYACCARCAVVGVTTERELAEALMDKERFIRLDAHIGLTGAFKSAEVWGGGSLPHRPCWYRLAAGLVGGWGLAGTFPSEAWLEARDWRHAAQGSLQTLLSIFNTRRVSSPCSLRCLLFAPP